MKINDKDNSIEGALRVGAIDKESFHVYNFLSKDDIRKDITSIEFFLNQYVIRLFRKLNRNSRQVGSE